MKAKPINLLNNNLTEVIHKFSIEKKIKVMGSNSYRGLLYPSDYDVVSTIEEPAAALADHLQKLFSKPLPFYFMDFKTGLKKTRWMPDDIAAGHKGKVRLIDSLKENNVIKLDYIQPIGDTFQEVSIIFNTKYQRDKKKKVIENELEQEIIDLIKEQNLMKALKRLFSLLLLQKKEPKTQKELVEFFNSDIGLVNKCANDLELLLSLLEKHTIPKKKVTDNIQMIKERLGRVAWVEKVGLLNKGKIEEMVKQLRSQINPMCKALLMSLGYI